MYGLPAEVDLSFLIGKELIQIAIGPYDVQLRYDTGGISIWSRFILTAPDGSKYEWCGEIPQQAKEVVNLVAAKISEVLPCRDGTLRLVFSNRWSIEIFDSDPTYEAYSISEEGLPLIVV